MPSQHRLRKYGGASERTVWPADYPRVPSKPGRKDTRRWCRGKVGVDHVPEIVVDKGTLAWKFYRCHFADWRPHLWLCRHRVECSGCGKMLRRVNRDECPDWINSTNERLLGA